MRKILFLLVLTLLYKVGFAALQVTITNPNTDVYSVCQGIAVNLTTVVSGNDTLNVTYSWSINNQVVSANSNFSYTATTIGNDTCVVIASTSIDTSYDTIVFVVNPKPIAAFTITGDSSCSGIPVLFSNTSTAVIFSTAKWSFPGATVSNSIAWNPGAARFYILPDTLTQNFTVTLIVTTPDGCNDTVISSVFVKPTPGIPTTITPVSYCKNEVSFPLSANGTFIQWYASPNGGTADTVSPTPSTSIDTTYIYYVSQTNRYGCESARGQINVVIHALPQANYTFTPDSACSGSSVSFGNTSSFATDFEWKFGDELNATATNPSHAYDTIGNSTTSYTAWLVASNQYGCLDSISHIVTIKQRPDARLKSDYPAFSDFENYPDNLNPTLFKKCLITPPHELQLVNLSLTSSTNTNYHIKWGDANNYNSLGSLFGIPFNTYSSLGSYILTDSVNGGNGCVSVKNYNVFIGTSPNNITITNIENVTDECAPQTYPFQITYGVMDTPGTMYIISSNDGTPNDTLINPLNSNPDTIYHTFNTTSCGYSAPNNINSFYVRINAKNFCGLIGKISTIEPITLNSRPHSLFVGPDNGCVGNMVSFNSNSIPGSYIDPNTLYCNDSSINYFWEIVPDTGWTLQSGSLGSLAGFNGSPNINVIFNSPGTYTVKLKTANSNINICPDDSVFQHPICISPHLVPTVPVFSFSKNVFCLPDTVNITNLTDTLYFCDPPVYTWNISCSNNACATPGCNGFTFVNGTTLISKNPSLKFTQPGVYAVSLTINNGCGTATSGILTITVKDKPTVAFVVPSTICTNENICINQVANVNVSDCYGTTPLSYSWTSSFGAFPSPSSKLPGCILAVNTGNQTITLAASNECGTNILSRNVTVIPLPVVTLKNNISVCPGEPINIGNFASIPIGATFTWTNSNISIGIPVIGNGNIAVWIAPVNNTGIDITGTITVIPTLGGCSGEPMFFSITIKPSPAVNLISDQYYCPFDNISTQTFSSNPIGASFAWMNSNTAIGIGNSGNTNIPSWIAPNNIGISAINGNISVTPLLNGCIGNAMNYTINIYPKPTIHAVNNISVCPGEIISIGNFLSTPLGAIYTWNNSNTSIGLTASGSGNISNWNAPDNTSGSDITATITVTPFLNACLGTSLSFTIVIKSRPVINLISNQIICSGQSTTAVSLSSNMTGTTFNWISSVNSSITPNPGNGSANTIPATIFNNSSSTPAIISYTITAVSNLCIGNAENYTVTVNPAVSVTNANLNQAICSSASSAALTITSNVAGVTYSWSAIASPSLSGYAVSGTANIPAQNITSTSTSIDTVIYTITPLLADSNFNCPGVDAKFKIAVFPIPIVTATPSSDTICSGSAIHIDLSSNLAIGTTYSWTLSNNPTITGAFAASGNTISQTLTNTSSSVQTISYTITPIANSCSGNPIIVTITVFPNAIASATTTPLNASICDNTAIDIVLSSTIASSTYTWTVAPPIGITGASSGNGNNIHQILHNTTYVQQTVNYIITPIANNCTGNPMTVTVLVNPTPNAFAAVNPFSICSGNVSDIALTSGVSGTTFTWVVVPNPNISGQSNGSGALIAQTLTNTTTVNQTLTYAITPIAASCVGSDTTAAIIVKPRPAINAIGNQEVCAGASTATTFFGSNSIGTTYSWAVSLSGSILPAPTSGNGLFLPAAILDNYGTTAGIATYTVTPFLNGCDGNSTSFTITVNPAVSVTNANLNQTMCSGASSVALTITSNVAGVTYSWSAIAPPSLSGYTNSGIGNIPVENIATTSTSIDTVIYTITPLLADSNFNCPGVDAKFKIAVFPIPIVTATPSLDTICSGSVIHIDLSSNLAIGTTYSWTLSNNPTITGAFAASGNTISQTLTNTSSSVQTISYTITPTANSCSGNPIIVTITVFPKPIASASTMPLNASICDNTAIDIVSASTTTSSTYTWTVAPPIGITGASVGSGNNIHQILHNTTYVQQTVNYIITPTANNCPGNPMTVTVLVNPTPNAIAAVNPSSICSGNVSDIVLTSGVSGTIYTWVAVPNPNISGQSNGSGALIAQTLTNTTTVNQTLTYAITPIAASCVGSDTTAAIIVKPRPQLSNNFLNDTICANSLLDGFTLTSNVAGSNFSWYYTSGSGISPSSGAGTSSLIPDITFYNSTTSSANVIFVFKAFYSGCPGDTNSRIVVVKPRPGVTNSPLIQTICSENTTNPIVLTANIPGTTFAWSAFSTNGVTGFAASGTSVIPSQTLIYNGTSQGIVNFQIIPANNSVNLSCPGTAINYQIFVNPKPIALYTYTPVIGGQPLSVAFTNQSTTQPLNNLWKFGNNFPDMTNQNPIVLLTNTGVIDSIYTIHLIVTTIQGCKDTVQHAVTVYPLPIAKFGVQDVCFGIAAQFTDSSQNTTGIITKWKWYFGDGDSLISNLTQPPFTHAYANPGTYTISLTVTNNLSISNTFSKNVIVHPLPFPNFSTTYDTLGCVMPASVAFTNTSTGALSYKWNFGDNSSATTFNASHIFANAGYYFVKLTDTTQFKCIDSIEHKIRIIDPPAANFALSVSDSCGPLLVTFTNQTTGLYLDYLWNFGFSPTSTLPGPFTKLYPAGMNDSIFYVSLSATNICGTKIHYDTITVTPIPITNFGMTQNWGCSPLPITFLDTIVGHPDSLSWNFGDGSPVVHSAIFSQNVYHTYYYTGINDTTYYITLIAHNNCGNDTTIKSVLVYPNTINAFFNTDLLFGCNPLSVHFTNFSQGATTYNWNFGDGNTANQANVSHIYATAGNYRAYLAISNGCSKDTMWSDTIRVFPSPIVGFIYSGNHCTYDSVSFVSVTPGLSQYSWNFGDGGQATIYNPKHLYSNFGNYMVQLIGYSSNGCKDTNTQIVTVQFTPTAKMSIANRNACSPLTTAIINQTDSLMLNNYSWTMGNGNTYGFIQPPLQTFSNSSNCNVSFKQLTLVAEYFGCYDTISDSVRVQPIPLSQFLLEDSCDFGVNTLVQVNNQSVCASGYIWNLNGNQVSVQSNPTISIPNPGYYSLQNIAYNLFNCKDTSEIAYHLFQSPFNSITMDTNRICEPFPATPIYFSAFVDSLIYVWNFGDGGSATGQNVSHIYNQAGSYPVNVKISGMGGCVDSSQLSTLAEVYPRSHAQFETTYDPSPYPEFWKVVFTDLSLNTTSWFWDFGDNSNSGIKNPSHNYDKTGLYWVTLNVSNIFGCPDSTGRSVWIKGESVIYAPNAFTPNGDGINETFIPVGNFNKDAAFEMLIFNRWGKMVYNTTAYIPWDGLITGTNELCMEGVYVWAISYKDMNGLNQKTRGKVTLLR